MGFTYLRGGLGTQAMGYSMEHYLQSEKSGTDQMSIDRRLGEDTRTATHDSSVSRGKVGGREQILKADICKGLHTWSEPFPSI